MKEGDLVRVQKPSSLWTEYNPWMIFYEDKEKIGIVAKTLPKRISSKDETVLVLLSNEYVWIKKIDLEVV